MRNYEHSFKNYSYAKAVQASISKDELARISKKLYTFMKNTELFDSDLKITKFWVAKKSIGGRHKQDKIMKMSEVKAYEEQGGKVRTILCYSKEVNAELKKLSDYLNEPMEHQHGFAKKRGILTALERVERAKSAPSLFHNENKAELLIDLENAYEQITFDQLYAVLDIALDLNHEFAYKLARAMCYQNHLFQGNPVAPVLFNICTRRIVKLLEKNLDDEVVITQYADDFSIVFLERSRVPKRLCQWITKLFGYSTFRLNEQKLRQVNTRRVQKSEWLGVARLKDKNGNPYMQANNRRKVKKKIRWFTKMIERGYFITTKQRSKTGAPISATCMTKGLIAWLLGVNKLNKSPFICSSLASSVYHFKSILSRVEKEKWYKEKFSEVYA